MFDFCERAEMSRDSSQSLSIVQCFRSLEILNCVLTIESSTVPRAAYCGTLSVTPKLVVLILVVVVNFKSCFVM